MEITTGVVVQFICAVIGAIVTVYVFFKGRNKDVAKEQLEKVYFPMVDKLEPYLFKLSSGDKFMDLMEETRTFLDENKMLAGYMLYEDFRVFYEASSRKKARFFDEFSNDLLDTYNRLLKIVGLPRMTIMYRLRHHLYDNRGTVKAILRIVLFTTAYIIFWLFISFCFLGLISLLGRAITG